MLSDKNLLKTSGTKTTCLKDKKRSFGWTGLTDEMEVQGEILNVFISAVWHKVNETAILLIYLRCDTNPAAFNPALCFSLNYFLSPSTAVHYYEWKKNGDILKPCIKWGTFHLEEDPHHLISRWDVFSINPLGSEKCFNYIRITLLFVCPFRFGFHLIFTVKVFTINFQ